MNTEQLQYEFLAFLNTFITEEDPDLLKDALAPTPYQPTIDLPNFLVKALDSFENPENRDFLVKDVIEEAIIRHLLMDSLVGPRIFNTGVAQMKKESNNGSH